MGVLEPRIERSFSVEPPGGKARWIWNASLHVEYDVCNDALRASLDDGDVTLLYGPPVMVML